MPSSYDIGQVILAEGEKSDFVGYIVEGEAEVSKRHGEAVVTVGRLKAGEYFGEMAAIEGREHGATIRACGPLIIERFEKSSFLERASRDSDLALELLRRLSHRLHTLDDAYAAAAAHTNRNLQTPRTDQAARGTMTLRPGSSRVADFIPPDGLALNRLPFVVGRTLSKRERAPLETVDLCLDDSMPYRLSRAHFCICRENGRVIVRDLNSHLGTQVNGTFIGQHFARDTAELSTGDNVIVAGGENSPYVFRIPIAD